jgi:hypothetical protein
MSEQKEISVDENGLLITRDEAGVIIPGIPRDLFYQADGPATRNDRKKAFFQYQIEFKKEHVLPKFEDKVKRLYAEIESYQNKIENVGRQPTPEEKLSREEKGEITRLTRIIEKKKSLGMDTSALENALEAMKAE